MQIRSFIVDTSTVNNVSRDTKSRTQAGVTQVGVAIRQTLQCYFVDAEASMSKAGTAETFIMSTRARILPDS